MADLPDAARVETGVVQFGDDWPGVFIRGDNAAALFLALRHGVLDAGAHLNSLQRGELAKLASLLDSCKVSHGIPPQEPLRDSLAALAETQRERDLQKRVSQQLSETLAEYVGIKLRLNEAVALLRPLSLADTTNESARVEARAFLAAIKEQSHDAK